MEKGKQKKKLQPILITTGIIVALLALSFFIYASDYYQADDVSVAAMQSGDGVTVATEHDRTIFQPDGIQPKAGFIFYPGGKVEASAYAPLMKALAQKGYACVLVKMPFNLAVFDINAAGRVIDAYPKIEHWLVGGHSLGGSMAAAWCAGNAGKCQGLVLLGSYSASDLSQSGLPVLVITGSKDGVLNREKFEASRGNLPANSQFLEIAGGNHAQYGDYGAQKDDGIAEISAATQQAIAADAMDRFFGQAIK